MFENNIMTKSLNSLKNIINKLVLEIIKKNEQKGKTPTKN